MNTSLKNIYCSAMTRVEFLLVVCVAIFGIYLFVRYQKTGEVFQISWRKPAAKTNTNPQMIRPAEIHFVGLSDTAEQEIEIQGEMTNSVSTNLAQRPGGENSSPTVPLMRLDDLKRQRVQIPTNAVWLPARKSPGVRIAFP